VDEGSRPGFVADNLLNSRQFQYDVGNMKGNSQVTLSKGGSDPKNTSIRKDSVINGMKKKKVRKSLGEIMGPHANKKLQLCNNEMSQYFETPEEKEYALGVIAANFKTGNHDYEYLSYGMTLK